MGSGLTDLGLMGRRCRTIRRIVHHKGVIAQNASGTVRGAMENIGRLLLEIEFDCGQSLTLLADCVTLEDEAPPTQ